LPTKSAFCFQCGTGVGVLNPTSLVASATLPFSATPFTHQPIEQAEDGVLIAEFLNDISIIHIERNQLADAELYLEEVTELAKTEKSLTAVLVYSTINRGVIHYYRKDFIQALKTWEEASALSRKLGDLRNQMIARHNIGEVHRIAESQRIEPGPVCSSL